MDELTAFHFLRPWWLLAFIPLGIYCYYLWQRQSQQTGIESIIAPELLSKLVDQAPIKNSDSNKRFMLLGLLWALMLLALAGPTWQQRPHPLFQSEAATIIILDLSPSMLAEDIKPSRISRAHIKIQELLTAKEDGLTALIVFAGEAYTVVPFTTDTNTIRNLLNTLTPGLLPIPGSNPEMALTTAADLLEKAKLYSASVLLITDDITDDAVNTISKQLPSSLSLTILGIGTESGAPIPYDNGFLTDSDNNMVIAKRSGELLQKLANTTDGYYLPMQADTSDITFFIDNLAQPFNHLNQKESQNTSDQWYEFGPTLLLLCLPLLALVFRRGLMTVTLPLLLLFSFFSPDIVMANSWDILWQNSEQRAQKAIEKREYDSAANLSDDPLRKGSAEYKQGNYAEALTAFEKDKSAQGHYNRGNSLAQLQRFDEAIAAYDAALALQPDLLAAQKNKQRIQSFLQHQKNNKNQQDTDNSNKDKQQSEQNHQQQENNNKAGQTDSAKNTDEKNSRKNEDKQKGNQDSMSENSLADESNSNLSEPSSMQNAEDSKQSDKSLDQLVSKKSLTEEENQALQQWLRKVPDDPSGLLRRKFEYEFQQRRRQYQQGEWELPKNNAHKRY